MGVPVNHETPGEKKAGYVEVWVCIRCNHVNKWSNHSCSNCEKKWEGNAREPKMWICLKCKTLNKWGVNFCGKCNKYYEYEA